MAELAEDIVELQTRIQFQEDTIQKLDEVVIRQGDLLDRMQRRILELEDRFEQLVIERDTSGGIPPKDEKPPHY